MIKINNRIFFSEKKPPTLIAEISANHCGSKNLFLKHIRSAAKSGADMIKIQTYEPLDITVNSSEEIFKIKKGIWKGKNYWDLYKKACTPFEWHKDAFLLAKKLKIILFSTPFSDRAVDLLEKFKVPLYKISSFEITDYSLIKKIAATKKPVILSTGMASEKEIKNAIKIIKKYHNKIIILYCVSGYPTPEHEANVSTIPLLKNKLKTNLVGLSDHTNSINTTLASISFKIVAVEKHFKLSNKIKSEDSKFSITPKEFKNLKKLSQIFFNCLGKPKKFIKESEKQSLKFRRSIFSKKKIKTGEKITKKKKTLAPKSSFIISYEAFV